MPIAALGIGARKAVNNCGFGNFEIRQSKDRFRMAALSVTGFRFMTVASNATVQSSSPKPNPSRSVLPVIDPEVRSAWADQRNDYTAKWFSKTSAGRKCEAEEIPDFAAGFCNSAEASDRAAANRLEHSILRQRFATRETLYLRGQRRRCKTYPLYNVASSTLTQTPDAPIAPLAAALPGKAFHSSVS
jgi:hypothetical protein